MDLMEIIKENFNEGYFNKSMEIPGLPREYPAWTLKQDDWIGVAIPLSEYKPFAESFSQVDISAEQNVLIDKTLYDIVLLKSHNMETRNEFAAVCASFVDPGKNGELREELTSDPAGWWSDWKGLLGNVSLDKAPYAVLGELTTLEYLLKTGATPSWSGADSSTHDVETEDYSVEVKSTIQRYGYSITISSIYQLRATSKKRLYLYFLRFEQSTQGRNIEDIVSSIVNLGHDKQELENKLKRFSLEPGRTARYKKYKIIEWKQYEVDSDFPRVTEESFCGGKLPENLVRFMYTIDLSGVNGKNLLIGADD